MFVEKEPFEIRSVVIGGNGQVGSAVLDVLNNAGITAYCIDIHDKTKKLEIYAHFDPSKEIDSLNDLRKESIDVMHICLPYSESFMHFVLDYIEDIDPKLVIIESTVIPHTTYFIYNEVSEKNVKVVYSPVRGQHNQLYEDYKRYTKWVSGFDGDSIAYAVEYFNKIGLKTRIITNPTALELIKLLDTTQYALNIAWMQEAYRFLKVVGAPYQLLNEFGKETEEFYHKRITNLYPGEIGGHCLIPNIKILNKFVKSELFNAVIKTNNLFKELIEHEEKT